MNQDQINEVKKMYDHAPFPASLGGERGAGIPLITDWINSTVMPSGKSLFDGARILIAGCGSGAEALEMAMKFPNASILGIDFSKPSIDWANTYMAATSYKNVAFQVVDLMDTVCMKGLGTFDFVLCHAVADYVMDPSLLLKNLAYCLREHGAIYMSVNSPRHPAKRIQSAFSHIFFNTTYNHKDTTHREALSIISNIMGSSNPLVGLTQSSEAYLQVDIFPPVCHHTSLDQWINWAQEHDLTFGGSLDAIYGLVHIADQQLSYLLSMDRSTLSRWMAPLLNATSYQMIFTRKQTDHFISCKDDTFFESARPVLSSSLGALPQLNRDKMFDLMPVTLRFQNFPDLVIACNAIELEVLRQCNGTKTLREILDQLPVKIDEGKLCYTLFKAYHYGILWY